MKLSIGLVSWRTSINGAAHLLAKFGFDHYGDFVWTDFFPNWLISSFCLLFRFSRGFNINSAFLPKKIDLVFIM